MSPNILFMIWQLVYIELPITFQLGMSQSFPDFAVCDLGPSTWQRASGHSICWTWFYIDENQHSFVVPLPSCSDWTKLLGALFSPLAQPEIILCHLQMLLPHLFSRSQRDIFKCHALFYTIHWHIHTGYIKKKRLKKNSVTNIADARIKGSYVIVI